MLTFTSYTVAGAITLLQVLLLLCTHTHTHTTIIEIRLACMLDFKYLAFIAIFKHHNNVHQMLFHFSLFLFQLKMT